MTWQVLWHLGHWPAGLEWLLAGGTGACGDTLFLLAPFVQRQKALGNVGGNAQAGTLEFREGS